MPDAGQGSAPEAGQEIYRRPAQGGNLRREKSHGQNAAPRARGDGAGRALEQRADLLDPRLRVGRDVEEGREAGGTFANRRAGEEFRDRTVEPEGVGEHQPSVAADAPAIL